MDFKKIIKVKKERPGRPTESFTQLEIPAFKKEIPPPTPSVPAQAVRIAKPTGDSNAKTLNTTELKERYRNMPPAEEKASGSQTVKKAKSVNIKELIKHDVENLKAQLLNYSEIFDNISGVKWEPRTIIDALYVLVKSLSLDAVSIQLLDFGKPGKFQATVSRGYKNPPGFETISILEAAISPDGPSLHWPRFMSIVESTKTLLAQWIASEGISRIGYAPIHDGKKILGFIITASYENREPSPLASPLLEMCGSGLGLSLGIANIREELPHKVLNSSIMIKDRFSEMMKQMSDLKSSSPQDAARISELADNCQKAMNESLSIIDKMISEAFKVR
ncbi:MAG: hypothetical protein A2017_12630 [Lentisphaerae bacterium GWF2_44_16]|nr:MAG: hypothetical protein A2017_12630 [Lentisphaerae bacterium GWF2_44_16]